VAEIEVPNHDEIHERGETAFGRRAALTTAIYDRDASVAILSTSRQMFSFSLVLAVLGVWLAVNGFVPLFSLPFLRHH
jgi:hypothetical protein